MFCTLSLYVQAQGQSVITGRVTDTEGPLPLATVSVKETSAGAKTDNDGKFSINIRPGTYTLVISSVGYITQNRSVTVKSGEVLKADFRLLQGSQEMETVVVTGKTKTQEIKESAFTVNAIEMKQFANTTSDLNQVLNRTTGVRIREQGGVGSDFNFSVNGLSGKAVKFFIDGVPTEVMGSAMALNNIPVNLAEQIEVYKGVVPVDLGSDALGGAVNVKTSQNISNYLDASYSYGSFNTNRGALAGQYKHDPSGLVLKASAFFNSSDNNYLMRGVEIWDDDQFSYVRRDFKRFHDNYSSLMGQLEAGFVNKKWADLIFLGVSYSGYDQDLQTGVEQQIVYGDVRRKGHALNTSLRYRKDNFLVKGLDANLFASRSVDNSLITDTSFYKYEWDGSRTPVSRAEMGGIKSINNISRPRTYARANLVYSLADNHSLSLNYTYDQIDNKTYNELIEDEDDVPSYMGKHIAGLAYQQDIFDRRLSNTLFAKYYGTGIDQSKVLRFDSNGKVVYERKNDNFNYYGYGIASRFKLLENFGLKASFEHSYRLQEAEEMFGNGYNTSPNLDLKPEQSDNLNAGAYFGLLADKHRLFLEGSWFYRDAADFIYFVPGSKRYENKSFVRVNGVEGEVRYNYGNLLGFSVNASYQNAINTTKYSKPGSSVPEITYMNRIPNQPWLFGNLDFSIGKNNLVGEGSRVQFSWYTQYVHWFYLSWEAFGNINSNSVIPDQYIHNAVLSYSRENGKYNVSLECRNLSDNLAYDNFRLQKPGRSLALKLRYFIK